MFCLVSKFEKRQSQEASRRGTTGLDVPRLILNVTRGGSGKQNSIYTPKQVGKVSVMGNYGFEGFERVECQSYSVKCL